MDNEETKNKETKEVKKIKIPAKIRNELKGLILKFSGKTDWLAVEAKLESIETLQDKITYIKNCVEFIKNNEPGTVTVIDGVK